MATNPIVVILVVSYYTKLDLTSINAGLVFEGKLGTSSRSLVPSTEAGFNRFF